MQNPTITVRLLAKEAAKYIHSKAFVLAFLTKIDRYPIFLLSRFLFWHRVMSFSGAFSHSTI